MMHWPGLMVRPMADLIFRESDHTYWLGEKKLPGVTTILSILGGYEGVPKHLLERAARRGTAVHKMTELDDAGELDVGALSDEMIGYLSAWQDFKRIVRPEICDAEVQGHHAKLLYAGTRDRCLAIKGKLGILDIKSSYMLMPTTGPQTAAYAEIFNQGVARADQAKKRWGLRLAKDGSYELKEYTDAGDMTTFVSCLNLYRWAEKHNKQLIKNIEEANSY